MNDDALYRRYRLMTGPKPAWRRWLGTALGMLLLAGCAWAAVALERAAHAPLWPLFAGGIGGLIAGALWARTDFWIPRSTRLGTAPLLLFYFAIFASEEFIGWLIHKDDSLAFILAYIIAIMTGLLIGAFVFGWSALSKPRPLIP